MKKYYFILLLLSPLLSIAQSNYKAGYIVNLNGDTLRGYIDFKGWDYNPEKISFKSSQVDRPRQLGVNDIKYFEVSGYVYYKRYAVNISLTSVDISSVTSSVDSSLKTDTVFLKILTNGKNVNFYEYSDNLKNRFYIQDTGGGTPVELTYRLYQDSTNNIVTKNTYRDQLNQFIVKYNVASPKLIEQIQEASYKESDLLPIVGAINGETANQVYLKHSARNPTFRVYAGAAYIASNYSGEKSNAPKFAIGMDALANPDIGSLVFRLEFAFESNKYTFMYEPDAIFNISDPVITTENQKLNILSIIPQVIYNVYNTDMFKVFIDAGYGFNFTSVPSDIFTETRGGQVLSKYDQPDGNNNNFYASFQAKAGVLIGKQFELYAAYTPKSSISPFTGNDLSSYQIGINYFFYFFGKGRH